MGVKLLLNIEEHQRLTQAVVVWGPTGLRNGAGVTK